MTKAPIFHLDRGDGPLLVSFPHVGTGLPDGLGERLTEAARALPDTDWAVDAAYPFLAELGATRLRAGLSRYVVDLNRPADDTPMYPGQAGTGLFPTEMFDGTPIYRPGTEPDAAERAARIDAFWRPYHETLAAELARIRAAHGYALLWEGHSIAAEVPRLFEGRLPDINLGTNAGAACPPDIGSALLAAAQGQGFSAVLDGRFKGGHITRHYGRPADGVLAVQLELSQAVYLVDGGTVPDPVKLERIVPVLRNLVGTLMEEGERWAAGAN